MIGKILSKAIKIVTLPIDAGEAMLDCMTGGDGKKASRKKFAQDVPSLSTPRNALCDVLESLDD